jgi:hypothetical protein
MTPTLRALLLALVLAPLGACTTLTGGAFEGVTGAATTRVAFEGTVGVPPAVLPRFVSEIQAAARARGLTLVPANDTSAPYAMRGFLASGQGGLTYVFDLYDRSSGALAVRLDGQSPVAGADPFTAEDGRALRDVATRGIDGVQRFVAAPRRDASPAAPADEQRARLEPATPPTAQRAASAVRTAFVADPIGLDAGGRAALRQAMRRSLGSIGFRVADDPAGADVRLSADATLNPPERGRQKLAVVWNVEDTAGVTIGEVRQLTMVPEGSLPSRWERTATAAAERSLPGVVALAPPR